MSKKGLKREDVFLTSKVWCTFHRKVEENLDMTLKDLGVVSEKWKVTVDVVGNEG